jgi:hypothetical protein
VGAAELSFDFLSNGWGARVVHNEDKGIPGAVSGLLSHSDIEMIPFNNDRYL